jgi:hypothetical protein
MKVSNKELGSKKSVSFTHEQTVWLEETAKTNKCGISKILQSLVMDAMDYEQHMAQAPHVDEPPPEMEAIVVPD